MGETAASSYLIDSDVPPLVPFNWSVEEHRLGGQVEWKPDNILLFLGGDQRKGSVSGNVLYKRFRRKRVLNACFLDFLLSHPKLIPKNWRQKPIYFWGTVYSYAGNVCIRGFRYNSHKWKPCYRLISKGWGRNCLAAIFIID